ncbi:MAG: tRNA (N6-isopentenyl adenosine(37)-C2)-methylthiotransferase MiaB [Candidatus Eremiobacteraeota bacterium]|nr:tRNA (N6-isopentenyl adenosine(37)-C2)-methylthiotransferase MiaB [Candidatus Eremiobacteraeota bacterium]
MAGIYIETFGCQMNEADSQEIADRATAAGYVVVAEPREASVVVLNTCTVRDNAERRAYGRMQHFRALKRADPSLKLVVCGCLAEQDRERIPGVAPHVDAVFGTSELARLGDALAAWRPEFRTDGKTEERLLVDSLGGKADCIADAFSPLRAFVTVQRGCSYYCTFCIVPHVRGRFDHRPMPEILSDVEVAASRGAREVMLVGQTVNAYRDSATGADFADLLERVVQLDCVERLTFVTSHPKDCTEKLARTLGAHAKLNPRFHLPVQSGSDAVLRRMNRKYTVADYRARVAAFRKHCPGWALTTDLIVGFPSETEEDFAQTLLLCEEMQFAQAFMFVYSPRRGTPAARWEQIPAEVANERLHRLIEVVERGIRAYHAKKIGTVVRALVQGPSRKDRAKIAAKTMDNVTVIAPASGTEQERFVALPWIDVAVEDSRVWGCSGRVVGLAANFDAEAEKVYPRDVIDLIHVA